MNSTINYYNSNAKEYFDKTINAKVDSLIIDFADKIPENGSILDVGCGSGRDSLFFLGKGFEVISMDASSELAKLAEEKIKQKVHVFDIRKLFGTEIFDGIWCMASLLHLPKEDMPNVLKRCAQALKENGQFFAAFKLGTGESVDENGRFFNYYQENELLDLLKESKQFDNIEFKITGDSLGRNSTQWINVFAKKTLSLDLDMESNARKKHKL